MLAKLIDFLRLLFDKKDTAETPVASTGPDGLRLIEHYEGLELKAYKDPVGIWTIGYGDTKNVQPGMVITRDEAQARLKRRLYEEFEPGVRNALQVQVNQREFDALVSFAYNLGVAALAGSTLMKKLNAGDNNGAANEFERWKNAGGKELLGLKRRRLAEKLVFLGADADYAIKQANELK